MNPDHGGPIVMTYDGSLAALTLTAALIVVLVIMCYVVNYFLEEPRYMYLLNQEEASRLATTTTGLGEENVWKKPQNIKLLSDASFEL